MEPYKNYLDGGQIATSFAGPGIVLGGMIHHPPLYLLLSRMCGHFCPGQKLNVRKSTIAGSLYMYIPYFRQPPTTFYTCTCTYQATALWPNIFLFRFGRTSYDWRATAKKQSPSMQDSLVRWFLWLLFTYSRCGTYSQATPGLLNANVIQCGTSLLADTCNCQ